MAGLLLGILGQAAQKIMKGGLIGVLLKELSIDRMGFMPSEILVQEFLEGPVSFDEGGGSSDGSPVRPLRRRYLPAGFRRFPAGEKGEGLRGYPGGRGPETLTGERKQGENDQKSRHPFGSGRCE
jgi:hypothetical protein